MDADALDIEITAFESMKAELAHKYGSDWIVMNNRQVAGHFQQFEDAARFVERRFPDTIALIRQVNPEPLQAPFLMIRG